MVFKLVSLLKRKISDFSPCSEFISVDLGLESLCRVKTQRFRTFSDEMFVKSLCVCY